MRGTVIGHRCAGHKEGKPYLMRSRSIAVLGLLGVLAVSAGGCQVLKAITPPAIIKHVTISAKVGTPDAKIVGTLKKGYPSNLPLWDGAGVVKNHVVKSHAGNSWSATLSTGDTYADVVKGMAAGFEKQGWTVETQDLASTGTSMTVLTVSGSTGQGVVTIAAQKDHTTQIGYVITGAGQ